MKNFISLSAAVLTLSMVTPAFAAPANTVFHYDALRQASRGESITESVLSGTIYPEIDKVHPIGLPDTATQDLVDAQRSLVLRRREKNKQAVQEHCKRERRATVPNQEFKCGAGFSK